MKQSITISSKLYEAAKRSDQFQTVDEQIEFWAQMGSAALDNPDLPIEFIRDILIAKKEKAEPFIFE